MKERFPLHEPVSLKTLLAPLGEALVSNSNLPDITVKGLARFGLGDAGDLCFCDREPTDAFNVLAAGSVVLTTEPLAKTLAQRFGSIVWVPLPDPRTVFIDCGMRLIEDEAIDASDQIPRPLEIHSSVRIGKHAVIGRRVRIDEGVVIGNQCVIHDGTWIQAGTVIRDNAVIGCEGINAYRGLDGRQMGFPHLAGVIVGARVEIGASTVIPRGLLTSTCIGDDTVIGNLCNVGHGVVIEKKVWMSVGCLIGGHTRIGEGCTLGMGVTVRDNLELGAGGHVGMGSVVARNLEPNASVFGNPARSVAGQIKSGPER